MVFGDIECPLFKRRESWEFKNLSLTLLVCCFAFRPGAIGTRQASIRQHSPESSILSGPSIPRNIRLFASRLAVLFARHLRSCLPVPHPSLAGPRVRAVACLQRKILRSRQHHQKSRQVQQSHYHRRPGRQHQARGKTRRIGRQTSPEGEGGGIRRRGISPDQKRFLRNPPSTQVSHHLAAVPQLCLQLGSQHVRVLRTVSQLGGRRGKRLRQLYLSFSDRDARHVRPDVDAGEVRKTDMFVQLVAPRWGILHSLHFHPCRHAHGQVDRLFGGKIWCGHLLRGSLHVHRGVVPD